MNGDIDCISRSQVSYFFEEATAGASLVRNKWAAVAFFFFLFLFVVVVVFFFTVNFFDFHTG